MLSLIRWRRKHKNYSTLFGIRIFLLLSFSFGIETMKMFIHSVVPSNTIPDSRPKWAKSIPVFRPKRHKNHTRWGRTHLYGLYKGVAPPPPPAEANRNLSESMHLTVSHNHCSQHSRRRFAKVFENIPEKKSPILASHTGVLLGLPWDQQKERLQRKRIDARTKIICTWETFSASWVALLRTAKVIDWRWSGKWKLKVNICVSRNGEALIQVEKLPRPCIGGRDW